MNRTVNVQKTRAPWWMTGAIVASAIATVQAGPLMARAGTGELVADALRQPVRVVQTAQAADTLRFNIPAGLLGDALTAFEAATGIRVTVANASIRTLRSPGVSGDFTAREALTRLLAGTTVGFTFTDARAVALDLRTTASVTVTAGGSEPTSPKFTSALIDTPQSISIISNEVFDQQGARNLTEVLRNTPGITFNAGENGFATGTSNFSLRGFDTSGSVFVDGVRDSGNYFRDVFNVEQVEVAKGPAGDNGRGSAGGYVNLATKTPRAENFTQGTVGYGFDARDSGNRPRATFDVNRQAGAGNAVRLNVMWQDGGVPGRATAEKSSWGVAPSAAFGLGGSTRLVLSSQHLKQSDLPDWGVPGAMIAGMNTFNQAADGKANRGRFYGHASDFDDVSSNAVLASVEHDLSPTVRVSNQTRWSNTKRDALYTIPTGFTPATGVVATQRQAFARDNDALANFTTLTASFRTGSMSHALAAGLEISHEESNANRYPTNGVLGNPGNTPVGNPDAARALAGFVGMTPLQTADVSIDTVAVYVYDTLQLAPKWQATGGLRVERYGVSLASKTAAGAAQGPDGYDRNDATVSGKVGLVYKPSAEGSIYAAVGAAALPPASYLSNPDISRDGDNAFPGWSAGPNSATSKVQRSTNYEVGTKWDLFDERFNATAAVFRTERTNIAMAGTVNGVANTFAGYGRQVIKGVELGATGAVTRDWTVLAGLLVMNSERRHSAEIDAARRAANPADYGTKTSTNGDQLAFTPRATASLWTTYRLPFGVMLGGGARYVGESFLGRPDDAERIIANGVAGVLPGYTVFDALVTYEVNRRLTLRFNIDNLTDKFYAISSNWPGSRVALGGARAFVVSTDLKF